MSSPSSRVKARTIIRIRCVLAFRAQPPRELSQLARPTSKHAFGSDSAT
jgi:hypothetical protein